MRILKSRDHILWDWDGNAKSSFHYVSGPGRSFSNCFHTAEKTVHTQRFSETHPLRRASKSF